MDLESTTDQYGQWRVCKVQYDWGGDLNQVAITANCLCVYQARNGQLLVIDLLRPHLIQQIKWQLKTDGPTVGGLNKQSQEIAAIFMDPATGGTALFPHAWTGELFWMSTAINSGSGNQGGAKQQLQLLRVPQKLRFKCRSRVTAVAWVAPESTAKALLIGTVDGVIYQSSPLPDFAGSLKSASFKQVYAIDNGEAINGMFAFNTTGNPSGTALLLSTATRLYCFQFASGRIDFSLYLDRRPILQEFPVNHGQSDQQYPSELRLNFDTYGLPISFAWTNAVGIYHGNLVLASSARDGNSLVENTHILPYPQQTDFGSSYSIPFRPPVSVAMTRFHFIMLYRDRVSAVCRLNDEIVWEERLEGLENPCLLIDNKSGTFWISSKAEIYEVVVSEEEKYVWRLYLKKNQFEFALDLVSNAEEKNEILRRQADYYLQQGKLLIAASTFAKTDAPFEEIALKFMQLALPSSLSTPTADRMPTPSNFNSPLLIGDIAAGDAIWAALTVYLQKIWPRFSSTASVHGLQQTLISTWLLELYLKRLALAQNQAAAANQASNQTNHTEIGAEYKEWISGKGVCEALDRRTAYQLFESYGRADEMIFYSHQIRDYDRVIDYHIQRKRFSAALETIQNSANNMDLIYKYSPELIEHEPTETVNMWIRNPQLNPKNLLPALLNYGPRKLATENQAIRYLEFCIGRLGTTDMAIHNYLLSLYANSDGSGSNERLLTFLKTSTYYDVTYALRLCIQHNRVHPSVIVYGSLGLYDEAVSLALEHDDIELAQIFADKPMEDKPRRKKLWLDIAKYVIHKHNDIRLAMEYVEKCGDLMRIEDILPFFPDFVVIGEFKEEICAALEKYKLLTSDLRRQMDEANRCAEAIRLDIRALKRKYLTIPANTKCNSCFLPLFIRSFMAFPCRHCFHADCLLSTLMKDMFSPAQQRRVIYLQEMIAREEEQLKLNSTSPLITVSSQYSSPTSPTPAVDDTSKRASASLEKFRTEFDDIVGSDCALCGHYLVQSIDRPFVDDRRDAAQIESWLIYK